MTIACEGVQFGYGRGPRVLDGVSFAAEPGRVLAVVGPNGAGKSTLLRLMAGLLRPTSGRVVLRGGWVDGVGAQNRVGETFGVAGMDPPDRARRIAYVSQRPSVAFAFTAGQVVEMGRHALGGDRDAVAAAMRMMDVEGVASRPFGALSAGQQQRVSIARAIAQSLGERAGGARFLLADEPLAALDPRHSVQTIGVLRELAAGGIGIVTVMHDLTATARVADDAMILDERGRLMSIGPALDVLTPETLEAAFGVGFERAGSDAGRPIIVPRQDMNRIRA